MDVPIVDLEQRRAYQREYSRRYRQQRQPKVRATQAMQWQKYRLAALAALGTVCVRCGCADSRVLEIDHVDGHGGHERKARSKVSILRRVAADPTGYQLLCANCHRIKTYEQGDHLRRA